MIKFLGSPILLQYAIAITANLTILVAGMGLVWPSPVLVILTSEDQTVLPRPITDDEGAWIVSIPFLTGMAANFISGHLMDGIGRKNCLILSCVPRIAIALMYLFAKDLWVILLARALGGSLDSIVYATLPTYVSEIASKEYRGALGTLLNIISSVGMLIIFGIGPFVSYATLNIILTCVSVASSMPLMFLPDTPYFLYSKGKSDEAQKLLTKLRGSESIANEEIKEYKAASQAQDEGKVTLKELIRNKLFLKATLIAIILTFSGQANGYTAVTFYLQPTLEMTNTSVRPEISSLVIGSIQLLASICTSLLSDRFGRKSILIGTSAGIAVGLIGLGAFFKVQEAQDELTGFLNFLPLVSIILIVFCQSAGIASIMWVIVSELFEGRTRAVGISIGAFVGFLTGFTVTRTLPFLLSNIGPSWTYWMSGIICISLCAFVFAFVPETKGRSFADIQAILGKKSNSTDIKIQRNSDTERL